MRFMQVNGRTLANASEDVDALLRAADQELGRSEARVTGDPSGLRAIAADYRHWATETGQVAQTLRGLPQALQRRGDWTGPACDAYESSSGRTAEATDRGSTSLGRQASALLHAATALETARNEVTNVRRTLVVAGRGLRQQSVGWYTVEVANAQVTRTHAACTQATARATAIEQRLGQELAQVATDLRASVVAPAPAR